MFAKLKNRANLAITFLVVGLVFAIFASSASAAGWTVLGGDPLFPGGIPNASQQGRNKFVHDMLSPKGVTAQKRAGFNAKDRQAFKQALVHGEFSKCTLRVGDHFEAMSFGVGAVLVDHNVTFGDPRYSAHGAPAFCVSVEVGKSGELIKVKVPFKCENFSVEERKHRKPKPPKKHHHHKQHHNNKVICHSKGMVGTNGNCSPQSNGQEECEAKGNNWHWEGNQCVQINVICGNVIVGSGNTNINLGGNCPITIVTPPPCGCKEEPKKPVEPEVIPDKNQEFQFNETAKEAPLCATVRPGPGTTITAVYFDAEYGYVENHKAFQKSTERFCTESYKAPSGFPPFPCTEPGLDPSAKWCDLLTWTAEASNGAKKSVTVQVPVFEPPSRE